MKNYDFKGIFVNDFTIAFGVSLPIPAIGNEYKIADYGFIKGENKLVILFYDRLGLMLDNPDANIELFKIELTAEDLSKIDVTKAIDAVLFHENELTPNDFQSQLNEIYRRGKEGSCSTVYTKKNDILEPKVCGNGSIKPL